MCVGDAEVRDRTRRSFASQLHTYIHDQGSTPPAGTGCRLLMHNLSLTARTPFNSMAILIATDPPPSHILSDIQVVTGMGLPQSSGVSDDKQSARVWGGHQGSIPPDAPKSLVSRSLCTGGPSRSSPAPEFTWRLE